MERLFSVVDGGEQQCQGAVRVCACVCVCVCSVIPHTYYIYKLLFSLIRSLSVLSVCSELVCFLIEP